MNKNTQSCTQTFFDQLYSTVGRKAVITGTTRTRYYTTGFRFGQGTCCAVVKPSCLTKLWQVLKLCVQHDKIIIMQAANTGLNGGSTPFGDDYDREIVIISTLNINNLVLLNGGQQVLAFAGATLSSLEDKLKPLNRGPHSVIGSSCIGASVIGGVCNNSGGNLLNRGPAYTELSLYAQLDSNGELQLVNHLDIDLGDTPEQILDNLQQGQFNHSPGISNNKLASDTEYQQRVRDISQHTPARFNADKRRLFETSGCAGKLAVFAVRLDTYPNPVNEQVFYIGTNKPQTLNSIRQRILTEFKTLPEMGEYMHRSYFDGSAKYSKDTFLIVKYFGASMLPRLFSYKGHIESVLEKLPLLPTKLIDHLLQLITNLLPNHLPRRLLEYRDKFEHHLIIKAVDDSIEPTRKLLTEVLCENSEGAFLNCNKQEGDAALLHRFVAGGAYSRYTAINKNEIGGSLTLDIALPRNSKDWDTLYPPSIMNKIAVPFRLAHFFCMVFHHDFVVKKGVNTETLKQEILALLNKQGIKYPAEHNVGHLYTAEKNLLDHYTYCDPSNTFNPGIGKTSKLKHYQ